MSTVAKALILTWVMIGFLIVGAVGFYLGRLTALKFQPRCPWGMQSQDEMMEQGGQEPGPGGMIGQPSTGSSRSQGGFQQPPQISGVPQGQNQGPAQQDGQQSPPAGGGQPPPQR